MKDVALDHYDETLREIRKLNDQYSMKKLKYVSANKILSSITEPLLYMILLYQIMVPKTVTIAGLALALSSFWALRWSLQNIIDMMLKVAEHGVYIEKIRIFLDRKPEVSSGGLRAPSFDSIVFQNVSFGYNPEREVLKNISFTLKKGEKIAIVGYLSLIHI